MIDVTVREFARLTTSPVASTLDCHRVTSSAFDHLCALNARMVPGGARLIQVEDGVSLRLDNFVGVIQTPCGTRLEILPKHVDHDDDPAWARALLKRMICSALDLPTRDVGFASIELLASPLSEWVMQQFLQHLDHLIKRGLRFDYRRVQEEQRFLRGRLDINKQLRQGPGRGHVFQIEHELFEPNRPENRLLRSALDRVRKAARTQENWRLAHELAEMMADVPPSTNFATDFAAWRDDRLVAHYRPIRRWCELVLGELMPIALRGPSPGISLLFPMEKLFERHVAQALGRSIAVGAKLEAQVGTMHLCEHQGRGVFRLQPDLVVSDVTQRWVLDTKWKRLSDNETDMPRHGSWNPGIGQADVYQMFAYGHAYLAGSGDVMLVYPKTKSFAVPLAPFHFSTVMRLWIVPFDLESDTLNPAQSGLPLVQKHLQGGNTAFASQANIVRR